MQGKSRTTKKRDHGHNQHTDFEKERAALLKAVKEGEENMLAQVDALVATTNTLKTSVDNAVAFIGSAQSVSQADLDALTSVNTTLTTATSALDAAVTAAKAK